VLLVTAILSVVVYYQFGEKINQKNRQNLAEIADHKATDIINALMFERTNLMSWRTSSVMLDVVVDDLDKRIVTELLSLKQAYNLKGDLYVFNGANILVASTQQDVLKTQFPQVWQIQNDYAFIFKHEVPFIKGNIIAHVTTLKPPHLKVKGYMIQTHSWDDFNQVFMDKDTIFSLHKTHQGEAELFMPSGIKMIDIKDDFLKQHIWIYDGVSYLGSISKSRVFDDFDFEIAAFLPQKLAQEPLVELIKNLLFAAILVGIPMLVLVSLLSRHFVEPIKNLTATILAIEDSNDLSITVPVLGSDEVSDLSRAFNRMTTRLSELFNKFLVVEKELEALNSSLEHKVASRTAQVQETLKKLQSTQTQLVQSEKMSSLGQLVAGIAHEINNPVGAICANMHPLREYINDIKATVVFAQSCLDELGLQKLTAHMTEVDYSFVIDDLAQLLFSQQHAAERIRHIIASLRNFSRLDQGEVKSVRFEDGLDSTLQILYHYYKDRINIEKDYQLNELVECYAGEINQVFMNILANAIQAIPDKGSIFISTAKVGDQAVINIADTGTGMPDEVIKKIFDPFFTTKKVGVGTGLGLSISYGIVEKHHGTLTVESELDHGTRFTTSIPLRLIKST
jgi:signal transduction histidine kinase